MDAFSAFCIGLTCGIVYMLLWQVVIARGIK